jgi:hypothetical protein
MAFFILGDSFFEGGGGGKVAEEEFMIYVR